MNFVGSGMLRIAVGVAVMVGLMGCAPTTEPVAAADEAGIDEVVGWVQSGEVMDVDELLDRLPKRQLESFVLMKSSRSRHRATASHPRMITYGVDARFLLAFSTDPQDPLFDTVELAEIDDDTGRWRFRAVDVRSGRFDDNAQGCVGCHGDEPRPIWAEYNVWPGAYGETENDVSQADIGALAAMMGDRSHRVSRFSLEYARGFLYLPARRYGYPNTAFNMELGATIAAAFQQRMRETPDYARLRDQLLLVATCDDVSRRATEALEAVTEEVAARVGEDVGIPRIRERIYLLLGVDPRTDWQIDALSAETPRTGNDLTSWFSALARLNALVDARMLFELLDEQPELEAVFGDDMAALQTAYRAVWGRRGEERRDYLATYSLPEIDRLISDLLDEQDGAARIALCDSLAQRAIASR